MNYQVVPPDDYYLAQCNERINASATLARRMAGQKHDGGEDNGATAKLTRSSRVTPDASSEIALVTASEPATPAIRSIDAGDIPFHENDPTECRPAITREHNSDPIHASAALPERDHAVDSDPGRSDATNAELATSGD